MAPSGLHPVESPLPAALHGLLRPDAYPHPVAALQVVETHMSWVILTGTYAYKIKRPVQFAFADFRDPRHRAQLCAEEIRLNRRFAPDLYLDVSAVRLVDGVASFTGDGPTIDTAVRMRQFDRADELDRLVAAAAVTADEFAQFGATLAATHQALPPRAASAHWGDATVVAHAVRRNYAECLALAAQAGTAQALRGGLRGPLGRRLRQRRPRLAARATSGHVRECHGDLHLSNLVRLAGRITPFDALEFEAAFRWIDVADEVAFLCADLQGYRRADLAAAFLSGYLDGSGDFGLLRVLDLYVAHRALVRAKIMAIRAAAATAAARAHWLERHADYVAVARDALAAPRPRLLLMHGLSGSGKTWLARRLARQLPAVHLRSDLERKRLAGLAPLADAGAAPGTGLYAAESGAQTYTRLAEAVRDALAGGHSVICDATFLDRARRVAFRAIADEFGAPTLLLDCTAPDAELRRRLLARQSSRRDPSDADEAVLDWQREHAEPLRADEGIATLTIATDGADPVSNALSRIAAARLPAGS
jgi:uncharacterized protein